MKCLVIDYIDEDIYREFQKYMEVDLMMLPTKQTLIKIIEPYEVLIMRVDPEIDEEVLDAAKNLRFIGVCSTGLNHIDRAAAEKRGIIIRNAPGMNANGVAELTICKMLELARSTIQSNYEVQDRRQWNKYRYLGVELAGKTVGIIGFGSIGQRVGELCRVFGMQVLAYNPHGRPGEYFTARGAEAADLDTILRRSDFITIHAPLTDETRGMIGAQEIVKMKVGAFVINMSRGGIVVEQDMYAALISGQLGGGICRPADLHELPAHRLRPLHRLPPLRRPDQGFGLPHQPLHLRRLQRSPALYGQRKISPDLKTRKMQPSEEGCLFICG